MRIFLAALLVMIFCSPSFATGPGTTCEINDRHVRMKLFSDTSADTANRLGVDVGELQILHSSAPRKFKFNESAISHYWVDRAEMRFRVFFEEDEVALVIMTRRERPAIFTGRYELWVKYETAATGDVQCNDGSEG